MSASRDPSTAAILAVTDRRDVDPLRSSAIFALESSQNILIPRVKCVLLSTQVIPGNQSELEWRRGASLAACTESRWSIDSEGGYETMRAKGVY